MTKTRKTIPELSLAVQYGIEDKQLPRWRLRRWVTVAVEGAVAHSDALDLQTVALTVRLVGQREGKILNQTYRQKDYATNVLTFRYDSMPDEQSSVMADIVICTPVLKREAREQGKPYLHHAAHLVVHGILHALGHDHLNARDANAMEALEKRILTRLRVPNPYGGEP